MYALSSSHTEQLEESVQSKHPDGHLTQSVPAIVHLKIQLVFKSYVDLPTSAITAASNSSMVTVAPVNKLIPRRC